MSDQPSLFEKGTNGPLTAERVGLPDADIVFLSEFFRSPDSDRLLAEIDETTVWRQDTFKMYGRETPLPRLTAWYGEPGKSYSYSKISMQPDPWTAPLREIKAAIETETAAEFNSVLLNLYRRGSDSVSWHSDDEPELGPEPVIASVSLGDTRTFQLRHKTDKTLRSDLELTHGSLLVMRGLTQRYWEHQIPKTARNVGPRVNLTYRHIT